MREIKFRAWDKELKNWADYAIAYDRLSFTEWEVAKTLIDAVGVFKTWNGSYKTDNVFDVNEIADIGNHLMNYANVERTDDY